LSRALPTGAGHKLGRVSVEAIAVVVTVVLALIGYVVKYLNDLRLAVRKDRLDRVNRQLSDLYGPLFALDAAGDRLWQEFRARYPLDWDSTVPLTMAETAAWRLWMTTIFMPLHRQMKEVVVDHADLLREAGEVPNCLLDLCANVAGYEIVAEQWRSGDFEPLDKDSNVSVVGYPHRALTPYLETAYHELKEEQGRLLRGLGLT
jgi:hypothetical protein